MRVNGEKVSKKYRFKQDDQVELRITDDAPSMPYPVSIPLEVVFEDEDLIVVNKPANMVTHPGNGTGPDTLAHALLAHCEGKLSVINGEDRPGIVHRLDKDTTGLIVAAKTDAACSHLIDQFKTRKVRKFYHAIVEGTPKVVSGECNGPISRHPQHRTRMSVQTDGKPALTEWEIVKNNAPISLLQCQIHTGRTHQIRVHLSHMGHPIVGDKLYGFQKRKISPLKLEANRPLLHASYLSILHPTRLTRMDFETESPNDFQSWINYMNNPRGYL